MNEVIKEQGDGGTRGWRNEVIEVRGDEGTKKWRKEEMKERGDGGTRRSTPSPSRPHTSCSDISLPCCTGVSTGQRSTKASARLGSGWMSTHTSAGRSEK